jgi:hypothetical protein
MENVRARMAGSGTTFVMPTGWSVFLPIKASATHRGADIECLIDWNNDRDHPRLVCTSLTFRQADGVLAQSLRFPLETLVKEAIARMAIAPDGDANQSLPDDAIVHPAYSPRRGKRGRPPTVRDDELPDVAKAYESGGIGEIRATYHVGRTAAYELWARARAAGLERQPSFKKGRKR